MPNARFTNPLTAHLRALITMDLKNEVATRCPSASQTHHVQIWNAPGGIREQAAQSGYLSTVEAVSLREALDRWSQLSCARRRDCYRVVHMLFLARRQQGGFTAHDRTMFESLPEFRVRTPRPRSEWRHARKRRQADHDSVERTTAVP